MVRFLVEHGAEKDKSTDEGTSPLYKAAREGRLGVVQYLLEQGADKDKTTINGFSPLIVAALFGHLPVMECLLQHMQTRTRLPMTALLHFLVQLRKATCLSSNVYWNMEKQG